MSGIFRDVYLIPFAKASIVDFEAIRAVADDSTSANLRTNVTVQGTPGPLNITLKHPDDTTLYQEVVDAGAVTEIQVSSDDLDLWLAETPLLYTLLLSYGDQYIAQKAGFRRIEMSDTNFLVNGKPTILYGINRYEHTPITGRTVPYDFIRANLIKMKRYNLNSIRTSHYPPRPNFFDVADELGFYVISEADLDCHGFNTIAENDERKAAAWLSENPDWEHAYVDRAEQLFERLKNQASTIFWSLGNECFMGRNFVSMTDYIHQRDPSRLVHYQPDMNATVVDIYSRMYLPLDEIDQHVGSFSDKPVLLVEYAHALGCGPGGLSRWCSSIHQPKKFRGSPPPSVRTSTSPGDDLSQRVMVTSSPSCRPSSG
jgi:beta-galactosidase